MMRMHVAALAVMLAACSSNGSNGGSQADAGGAPVCGDGVCAVSELDTCQQDCGTRGSSTGNPCNLDGVCEPQIGETPQNCPSDCQSTGSGSGSGSSGSGSGSDPTGPSCTDNTGCTAPGTCCFFFTCEAGTADGANLCFPS